MPWNGSKTWVAGEVVGATAMNTYVRDNLNYLLARPLAVSPGPISVTWTYTSTSYVPVATSTDLAIVTQTGRLMVGAKVIASASVDMIFALRINIDAGISTHWLSEFFRLPHANQITPLPISPAIITGLATGTQHTLRMEVAVNASTPGTLSIFNLNVGRAFQFWAMEV